MKLDYHVKGLFSVSIFCREFDSSHLHLLCVSWGGFSVKFRIWNSPFIVPHAAHNEVFIWTTLSQKGKSLPPNCTTDSRVVYKNKATQAVTGNCLASLCHINETRKHYSAVFALLPRNTGYSHCSVAQLQDLQRKWLLYDRSPHPPPAYFMISAVIVRRFMCTSSSI